MSEKRIQFRRGTAEAVASQNPLLAYGEPLWVDGKLYVGDGKTLLSGLTPVNAGGGGTAAVKVGFETWSFLVKNDDGTESIRSVNVLLGAFESEDVAHETWTMALEDEDGEDTGETEDKEIMIWVGTKEEAE